jgi:hypothetical protein
MAEQLSEITEELKRAFDKAVLHFINDWTPEQPEIKFDGHSVREVFERVTDFGGDLKQDAVARDLFLYFSSRFPRLQGELGSDETYPTAAGCLLKAMDWRIQEIKPPTKP